MHLWLLLNKLTEGQTSTDITAARRNMNMTITSCATTFRVVANTYAGLNERDTLYGALNLQHVRIYKKRVILTYQSRELFFFVY